MGEHDGFHRKSMEAQCVSEHSQGKTSTGKKKTEKGIEVSPSGHDCHGPCHPTNGTQGSQLSSHNFYRSLRLLLLFIHNTDLTELLVSLFSSDSVSES